MEMNLESIPAFLSQYRHIVVTAHINPDGDAIGSLLALQYGLKALNKKVTCLIDDDIPENFQILPGYECIAKPEQNISDADLLIVLDCSDLERIGRVKDAVQAPVLNIDHHISNNGFADFLYLDAGSAATGEIIFHLLKLLEVEFTQPIAAALYTAIATDCGFFRYANTSQATMRIGAELLGYGVRPNLISEAMETKTLQSLKSLGEVLNSLELFAEGKIACITITRSILEHCDSTEGFIDFPRMINGVDVAVMVKYVEEQTCRISMRSKNTDVSAVALTLSGGGHVRAAGCTIHESLDKAKQIILQKIQASMEA